MSVDYLPIGWLTLFDVRSKKRQKRNDSNDLGKTIHRSIVYDCAGDILFV